VFLLLCSLLVLTSTGASSGVPPAPVVLQTQVIIGPNDAIGFDYTDADLQTYAVIRFEASWDGQPYATVQPVTAVLPDTPVGSMTYKNIPPFSSGNHTVVFRACRLEGCGGGSVPFAFAYPVVNPTVPMRVRRVPR
jgi:hypothetical protein